MKIRYLFGLMLSLLLIISGCSMITDLNNSIDYVTKATEYINKMNSYSQEIPPLFEKAATDPSSLSQLQTKLQTMKTDIQNFDNLNPPDFAANIHQSIKDKNQAILGLIDTSLADLKDGKVTIENISQLPIFKTIQELNGFLNQLQQLQQ
ncbi:hypothetical protein SAMN05444392_106193 [Seinonella peptonophila]|uniref:Lipoprotein n=1 Tax=Seinonella peptonophila TaxID=112248 RepID=A0A1M4YF71_9BACL|nr:DUF6376 family protein [Seinonella peptonophila]SHF04126.1 hypothetical protein SAMN05444392_106193 [Seinonella peptonophila]